MVNAIIDLVINVTVGLLGLRFIMKLFGANPSAPFADWIYGTTDSLLSPFRGIFTTPRLEGGIILELSTIFAIIIYLMVGYLLEWTMYFLIDSTSKGTKK